MDAAASPAAPAAPADAPAPSSAADPAPALPRASPPSVPPFEAAGVDGEAETGAETLAAEERLRVRLKTLDEHVFELDATPSTPVAAFREQVARVTQVPPPRQRLIYRGKLMKDGAALSTYDVQDGHTVHLVAKPPASAASGATARPVDAAVAAASSSSSMQTPTGWERNRDRLRHLLSTIDGSDNDESEVAVAQDAAASASSTLRRRTPSRERGRLTGNERNIATMREALDRATERANRREASRQTQRLPQFREFFGDLETSSQSIAAEMGLAPPTATGSSNGGAGALDLEHIAQGMMTVRTVLSTAATNIPNAHAQGERGRVDETGPQTPPSSPGRTVRGRRRFFVGQWIDVKDTVNQWLECTVMDIAHGKVLVHYHGWPTRWDEWIEFDSSRIAAFRTRTLHSMNPRQMSPVPSTRVQEVPRVGSHDVREMVTQLRDLMHEIMPHLDRFADLCEAQPDGDDAARDEEYQVRYDGVEGHDNSARDQRVAATVSSTWDRGDEVSEMAHLMAPVFDRVGRMLVDSARCLDPLLRPELQATSQRQQHRLSVMRGRNSSSSLHRQATAARVRLMEVRDPSLSMRDLIATSPRHPGDTLPPRRSIDVHIHAIVSPASLSSFASLGRSSGLSSGSTQRTIDPPAPREPDHQAFGDAFGIPSLRPSQGGASRGQAILNDDDDSSSDDELQDQSRIPLLGLSRGDDSAGESRRRRTVEENLDAFLEDDFFGPSFDQPPSATNDDHAPSPSSQYSSIASPISERSSVAGRGHGIPEIAEAEEREQMRARDRDAAAETSHSADNHEGDRHSQGNEHARESLASSSSSSSASFPTFLEVMRRTLNNVRNLGLSSNSAPARSGEAEDESAENMSSPSSSMPSLSPRNGGDERRSYESHVSEVEEDELDQLD